MASKQHERFSCEDCSPEMERARNCGGQHGHTQFVFQIGDIRKQEDIDDKIIHQCPISFITQFTQLLWGRYQDAKLKHEIGADVGKFKKIHFDAFRIFMAVDAEHWEMQSKKDSDKMKDKRRGERHNVKR